MARAKVGGFRSGRKTGRGGSRVGSPRQKGMPKPPPGAEYKNPREDPDFLALQALYPLITFPEYLVYRWLERRLGWRAGIEFTYLDYTVGVSVDRGDQQIDFTTITMLALPVDGVFFHLDQGPEQVMRDKMNKWILQGEGYTVVTLLDVDLTTRLEATMTAALQGLEMPTVALYGSSL